ncbi:MAG: calcium-binding protein [Methyloceanibacter sp.]|uniref:calcium-binding protein n=1 Tax=Methyloceanibacter sp. TaxID=1965321 RepID=UPI003D6C6FDF
MTQFVGTSGADTANATTGVLIGFSGGGLAQLQDNQLDEFHCEGGNDVVVAGPGGDGLYGGEGNDSLDGGAGDDVIEGEAGNDTLTGGIGNDLLIGGAGADTVFGGSGNDDIYINGSEGIADSMNGGSGVDSLVFANFTGPSSAVTLSGFNAGAASIEKLLGNDKGLFGTAGANTFDFSALKQMFSVPFVDGGEGNDTIIGFKGSDTLRGGAGDDVLNGGLGRDTLFGGPDADRFDFNSIKESKKGGPRDKIMDFKRGQDDVIDLRDIDAKSGVGGNQNFKFIGKQDFHEKKGELRYEDKGSTVIVQGDTNGDGKADFEIFVNVGSLAKGDFIL